jgi:ATP-dependent Clp protease ATP-binding subunit ClpC
LLREDKPLASLLLHSDGALDSIRKRVADMPAIREKNPSLSDVPLSRECKRALADAAMEAENRGQQVAPAHLLLGLLHDDNSFAAELLREHGLTLASAREKL